MSPILILAALLPGAEPRVASDDPPAASSPLPPERAVESFRIDPHFRIELAAAEPEVRDPVAIEWDAAGRLWVVEMSDYPLESTGGRLRLLEDADRDGRFERNIIFRDGLPFPTSVLPHRRGVLVAAAPEILYLEDSDGDGRADLARPVLTGFAEGNTQLRVNGLRWGIDNRVYGANGRSGGKVRRPGDPPPSALDISRSDFRFVPDRGPPQAAAGPSQFGQTFDDWGRRFLSWNTIHIRQEVLSPRDLERHPYLLRTAAAASISDHGDSARIYSLVPPPRTFNSEPTDHFNAGCGLTVERGGLFPEDYRGDAFSCEPLVGLVHRDRLVGVGPLLRARRADQGKEFLASTDPWFHPVNLKSGPDGALYVVDFYRELVEHPHFVPESIRGSVDFTRGHGHGRIWRILPIGAEPFPVPDLTALSAAELTALLAHPNAHRRETAQRLLRERGDRMAVPHLIEAARSGSSLGRIHALWTLEALDALGDDLLREAARAPAARVREHAVRLARERPERLAALAGDLIPLLEDADGGARFQAALAVGDLPPGAPGVAGALARLARRQAEEPWFAAAILSSLRGREADFLEALPGVREDAAGEAPAGSFAGPGAVRELAVEAAEMAGAAGGLAPAARILALAGRALDLGEPAGAFALAGALARGLERSGRAPGDLFAGAGDLAPLAARLRVLAAAAAGAVRDPSRPVEVRRAAAGMLECAPLESARETLLGLLRPQEDFELQAAAARSLSAAVAGGGAPAEQVLEAWPWATPRLRRVLLAGLEGRPEGAPVILAALERGAIQPRDLGVPDREALRAALGGGDRGRLDRLLAATSSRREVIARYRAEMAPLLEGTAPAARIERGREVFLQHCAGCHRAGGLGHDVGPDLAAAARQGSEALLESILDPNRAVEPGYAAYTVLTRSGHALGGILAAETSAAITLRQAEGIEVTVPRQAIRALRSSGTSLMPDNLEEVLPPGDAAALIRFLSPAR